MNFVYLRIYKSKIQEDLSNRKKYNNFFKFKLYINFNFINYKLK